MNNNYLTNLAVLCKIKNIITININELPPYLYTKGEMRQNLNW